MPEAEPTDLNAQIAIVTRFDPGVLGRARDEVLRTRIDWMAEYGDYQSGGWWTASLLNGTGEPQDVVIGDCTPKATSLLEQLPSLRRLLDQLDLDIMWARIARLAPNSFLWEHRDYGELSAVERYRLHIPLLTCDSAFTVIGGQRVHLSTGHLWRLVPTFAHGVCNFFGPDRVHVIIDCYGNSNYHELLRKADAGKVPAVALPPMLPAQSRAHVSTARDLIDLGYEAAAQESLLRLFFRYALPVGGCYDLIADLYESLGKGQDAQDWRIRKIQMMAN